MISENPFKCSRSLRGIFRCTGCTGQPSRNPGDGPTALLSNVFYCLESPSCLVPTKEINRIRWRVIVEYFFWYFETIGDLARISCMLGCRRFKIQGPAGDKWGHYFWQSEQEAPLLLLLKLQIHVALFKSTKKQMLLGVFPSWAGLRFKLCSRIW